MIHGLLGASWKPKLIAVMAAISLVIQFITALIDGDAKTVPNIEAVITQLLIIAALFQTRQNLVTSEMAKQGAKQKIRH
jgi:hypothetical protein